MDSYLSKPVNAKDLIRLVESLACASAAAATPATEESLPARSAAVFDPEMAFLRPESHDIVREMIRSFFEEADSLFPQMRLAVQKGDWKDLGRLGHRLKGTLVYLAAEPAIELPAVECLHCFGGEQIDAEEAVETLQRACDALRAALAEHQTMSRPSQET